MVFKTLFKKLDEWTTLPSRRVVPSLETENLGRLKVKIDNKTKRNLVYNGLTLKPGVNEVSEDSVKRNESYLEADFEAGNIAIMDGEESEDEGDDEGDLDPVVDGDETPDEDPELNPEQDETEGDEDASQE